MEKYIVAEMTQEEKIAQLSKALESLLADIKFDGAASQNNVNKAEAILKAIK